MTMNWISVTKKLPPCWDGVNYWWVNLDGDYDEEGNGTNASTVTHWMKPDFPLRISKPIPSPPTQEGQES